MTPEDSHISVVLVWHTVPKELYMPCKSHNHSIDLDGRQCCPRSLNQAARCKVMYFSCVVCLL